MKLILLTSFLGMGISSVLSVSGHIWTSEYTRSNTGSEIKYYLDKNQIYGSIISPGSEAGIHLRVGKKLEAIVGDSKGAKHSTVICKHLGDDAYLDDYEPEIQYYGDSTNAPFGTFIHRQVWDCESHDRQNKFPPLPEIHFYRIVNVMRGIRPVHTIFYFDGIEVIKDTASTSTDAPTVTFKEIKYLDPETKKVLIFFGKVHLKSEHMEDPMKQFKPLDIFQEIDLGSLGTNYKAKTISTKGEILRVGKNEFTTWGNKEDEAVCEFQLEEKGNVLKHHYLPQCSIWKPIPGEYDEFYGVGKVSENYFSIMNQELWKCTFETTEDNGKGTNKIQKTFYRRVTEMVAAIPISKIEYLGAISVWKYRLDSTSNSVRIKEIYYHQEDNIDKQIRFNGAVTLKEYSVQKKDPKLDKEEDAFFYTYKSTDVSYHPQIIGDKSNKPKRVGERIYDDEKDSTSMSWLKSFFSSPASKKQLLP